MLRRVLRNFRNVVERFELGDLFGKLRADEVSAGELAAEQARGVFEVSVVEDDIGPALGSSEVGAFEVSSGEVRSSKDQRVQ